MIEINDDDVCPVCGAYWSGLWCCNGHPREFKKRAWIPPKKRSHKKKIRMFDDSNSISLVSAVKRLQNFYMERL